MAGTKADTGFLWQHPKTLGLRFRSDLGRANRDNVIDGYINGNGENVCADGIWQNYFTERPERLTEGDKKAWLWHPTGMWPWAATHASPLLITLSVPLLPV